MARLTALKEFGVRSDRKKLKTRVRAEAGKRSQRRCGRCNQTGHNARTCKKAAEVDSKNTSCCIALYRAKVGCFAPEWGGFGGGLAKSGGEAVRR
jgi:hypothetical protein